MVGRVALDTNVLVYASRIGPNEADITKARLADQAIAELNAAGTAVFVAAQTLVELHDVLCRKGGFSRAQAALEITCWQDELGVMPTSTEVLSGAIELSAAHNLRIFDAVILNAAAEAGCDQLLTEDLQAGFVWRGVEVVNPFV